MFFPATFHAARNVRTLSYLAVCGALYMVSNSEHKWFRSQYSLRWPQLHQSFAFSSNLIGLSKPLQCQELSSWPDIIQNATNILVRFVDPSNGALLGCGFVWRRGLIVTSAHLFSGMPDGAEVLIQLPNNRRVNGNLVARSEGAVDIAVVRTEDASSLPNVGSITACKPRAGESVACVAAAKHCIEILSPIGRVVTTNQQFQGMTDSADSFHFMQVGFITLPGMSGAPLVNNRGEVVGMMQKRFEDYGLALHGVFVDAVAARLMSGTAPIPALGLALKGMPAYDHNSECGMLVTGVTAGGIGDRGGIETGDELFELNGFPCINVAAIRSAMAESKSNKVSILCAGPAGNER